MRTHRLVPHRCPPPGLLLHSKTSPARVSRENASMQVVVIATRKAPTLQTLTASTALLWNALTADSATWPTAATGIMPLAAVAATVAAGTVTAHRAAKAHVATMPATLPLPLPLPPPLTQQSSHPPRHLLATRPEPSADELRADALDTGIGAAGLPRPLRLPPPTPLAPPPIRALARAHAATLLPPPRCHHCLLPRLPIPT